MAFADGARDTRGNPVPIVDRVSGRITLLTTHNPGPDCGKHSKKCTRTPYLQLTRGTHKNRMVVGITFAGKEASRAPA